MKKLSHSPRLSAYSFTSIQTQASSNPWYIQCCPSLLRKELSSWDASFSHFLFQTDAASQRSSATPSWHRWFPQTPPLLSLDALRRRPLLHFFMSRLRKQRRRSQREVSLRGAQVGPQVDLHGPRGPRWGNHPSQPACFHRTSGEGVDVGAPSGPPVGSAFLLNNSGFLWWESLLTGHPFKLLCDPPLDACRVTRTCLQQRGFDRCDWRMLPTKTL